MRPLFSLPSFSVSVSQELIGYFNCLADISRHPVFLYDLPGLTGTKIELQTVLNWPSILIFGELSVRAT